MNTKKPLKLKTLIILMALLIVPFLLMALTYGISLLLGSNGDGLRFALGIISIAGFIPWLILALYTYAYAITSIQRPENSTHRTIGIISTLLLTAGLAFSIYASVTLS